MSTFKTEALVQLIKSLSKAEKRSFRLFVTRNQNSDNILFLQLFDEISKSGQLNEDVVLEKIPGIKKRQLSNLKAHLYKQLLICLRMLSRNRDSDIEIKELSDYAKILYQKGLYRQSLDILQKAKKKAVDYQQHIQALEIIDFEKFIEGQYITRSKESKADQLQHESDNILQKVNFIQKISNIALQNYAMYLQVGHIRNEEGASALKRYFEQNLPSIPPEETLGFYERSYYYQAFVWYYFLGQDFISYYKYCKRWLDLYEEYPEMKNLESSLYLKAIHNVLSALYMITRYDRFVVEIELLYQIGASDLLKNSRNIEGLYYLFRYIHFFNYHFLQGSFTAGLQQLDGFDKLLKENPYNWDEHRIMVFNYKMACLNFGASKWGDAITYLNKIIQEKPSSYRQDIQCFGRILNLIAHYELGNKLLLEYHVKSVYRFLGKMEELQQVQLEIFKFVRKVPRMIPSEVTKHFQELKDTLDVLREEQFEKRAFLYLDIISWLESKLHNKSVETVIQEKFRTRWNRDIAIVPSIE